MNRVMSSPSRKKVFLAYGRNLPAAQAIRRFLQALGLTVIGLPDGGKASGKGTPMIQESLERAFNSCWAAVLLWTGDDIALLRGRFWKSPNDKFATCGPARQPRPNVIYELGWAMKHYDKRFVIAQIGDTREPSNVHGLHYCKLESINSERKFARDLKSRLEGVGCQLQLKPNWQTAGGFGAVLEQELKEQTLSWIQAGTAVRETQFSYAEVIDEKCERLFIIGHNLADVLGSRTAPNRRLEEALLSALENNPRCRATIVLASPDLLKRVHKLGYQDLVNNSIPRLIDLLKQNPVARERLNICFNDGALVFPCFVRDPDSTVHRRALIVATPRWLTDAAGEGRMFFAFYKTENGDLFRALWPTIASAIRNEKTKVFLDVVTMLTEKKILHPNELLSLKDLPSKAAPGGPVHRRHNVVA